MYQLCAHFANHWGKGGADGLDGARSVFLKSSFVHRPVPSTFFPTEPDKSKNANSHTEY